MIRSLRYATKPAPFGPPSDEALTAKLSTALLVSGAVLAATGVGLTSWGVVRMRRQRGSASARAALVPTLARQHLGAQLTMAF